MSSSEKEWYLHVISAKQIHALQTHVRQVIVGALLGDGCIIAPKKAEVGPRTCCSLRMQLQTLALPGGQPARLGRGGGPLGSRPAAAYVCSCRGLTLCREK
jgi:hypothetical protein